MCQNTSKGAVACAVYIRLSASLQNIQKIKDASKQHIGLWLGRMHVECSMEQLGRSLLLQDI